MIYLSLLNHDSFLTSILITVHFILVCQTFLVITVLLLFIVIDETFVMYVNVFYVVRDEISTRSDES